MSNSGPVTPGEPLLNATQVARLLSMSRSFVYTAARRKLLPSITIGRSIRFHWADVMNFLENRKNI
jgi:excisionase family DNA binding protein